MKYGHCILALLAMLIVATTSLGQSEIEGATTRTSVAAQRDILMRAIENARAADAVADEDLIGAMRLYRAALDGFLKLRDGGVRTAALEYNIATLYARLEEPGRAIVACLRGARLSPHDERIARALNYARWLRDGATARATASVAPDRRRWFDALRSGWVWPAIVAWNVAWLLLLRRLGGEHRSGVALRVSAIVAVAVAVGVGVTTASGGAGIHSDEIDGVIVSGDTLPRKGCGENYDPAVRLSPPDGTEFRWIETREDGRGEPWYRIVLADGVEAWMRAEAAELIERPDASKVRAARPPS